MLTQSEVVALRMKRQFLLEPSDKDTYDELFQNMSPVPTMYWCAPGNPPTMPPHVAFDEYAYNTRRRLRHDILKGRFCGGNIAYVTSEDLEVFACLYKKELAKLSPIESELMELFVHEGPMNIGLMKEITGLHVKDITPALHKLQEAFLIYEDQVDNEGDRGWCLFQSEFPEVDLNRYSKTEALQLVIPRFAHLCVLFDEAMLKSYYRLPLKLIKESVLHLLKNNVIQDVTIENQRGCMLRKDIVGLQHEKIAGVVPHALLLGRNDFLVRAFADELKLTFTSQWDTLYYILIDGEFHGAVTGRFKFGPHIIEDIVIDLSDKEKEDRKVEIMDAVYKVFDHQSSPVKRYDGKDMT